MIITLKRLYTSKIGTLSAVSVDGIPLFYKETGIPMMALEPYDYWAQSPITPTEQDYVAAKKYAKDDDFNAICIPPGKYKVVINHSNKFNKDLPLLLDVPAFKGIRIHSFNWVSDTLGCIGFGIFRDDHIEMSRLCCNQVQEMISSEIKRGKDVYIEIKKDYV